MQSSFICTLLLIILVGGTLSGCTKDSEHEHSEHEHEHGEHEHEEGHEEGHETHRKISSQARKQIGMETEIAGERIIREVLKLHGRVLPHPLHTARVSARFPGLLHAIHKLPGDHVEKGDVLADIESNESLKLYQLRSPLRGEVLALYKSAGEMLSDQQALFLVGDLSRVWVEMAVSHNEYAKLHLGQTVMLEAANQGSNTAPEMQAQGKIIRKSPMADPDSQSLLVYAEVENASRAYIPELFVDASVLLAERKVAVAVKKEALQRLPDGEFQDKEVVFIKKKNEFEAAILELGAEDEDWVEVRSGLQPGMEYVTKNSFVVKADMLKAGATHDH